MLGNQITISTAGRQEQIESVDQRDGPALSRSETLTAETVELTVTLGIRDLFLRSVGLYRRQRSRR